MKLFSQKKSFFAIVFLFGCVCAVAQEAKPSTEYLKEKRWARTFRWMRNGMLVLGGSILYTLLKDDAFAQDTADWFTIFGTAEVFGCAIASALSQIEAIKAERKAKEIRKKDEEKRKREEKFWPSSWFKSKNAAGATKATFKQSDRFRAALKR